MALKYQTFKIILANGTPAGTYDFREPLLPDMDTAIGYVSYENKNTSNAMYRIRVNDDAQVYQQLTNKQDYQAGTNVPKNQRYSTTFIPAKSNQVTVAIQLLAPLTAELDLDFVFMLEKK